MIRRLSWEVQREWKYIAAACLFPLAAFVLFSQTPAYWEDSWRITARLVSLSFLALGMSAATEWRSATRSWLILSLLGRRQALALRAAVSIVATGLLVVVLSIAMAATRWLALGPLRFLLALAGLGFVALIFYATGYLSALTNDLRIGVLIGVLVWCRPVWNHSLPAWFAILDYVFPTFGVYAPRGLTADFPTDITYGWVTLAHGSATVVVLAALVSAAIRTRSLPLGEHGSA